MSLIKYSSLSELITSLAIIKIKDFRLIIIIVSKQEERCFRISKAKEITLPQWFLWTRVAASRRRFIILNSLKPCID